MNNKKIIDYVMQSPNNTNPAVLESMLEAINSGGRLALHRSFSSVEEMQNQPQWDALVKVFDETPTIEQVRGGMFLYTSEVFNHVSTSLHKFIGIPLDESGIVGESGSWAVCVANKAIALCITEEIREMVGAPEAGIYLAAGAISDSDTREVILIGT